MGGRSMRSARAARTLGAALLSISLAGCGASTVANRPADSGQSAGAASEPSARSSPTESAGDASSAPSPMTSWQFQGQVDLEPPNAAVAAAPDGSFYALHTDSESTPFLVRFEADGSIRWQKQLDVADVWGLDVSPDGSRLYLYAGGQSLTDMFLRVLDEDGNELDHRMLPFWPNSTSVTADGSRVYLLQPDDSESTILALDAEGKARSSFTVPFNARQIASSPDGSRIYIAPDPPSGLGLSVYNPDGQQLAADMADSPASPASIGGLAVSPDGSRVYMTDYSYNDGSGGRLLVFDGDGRRLAQTDAGSWSGPLVVSPDGSQVHMLHIYQDCAITTFDRDGKQFADSAIPQSNGCNAMVRSPDGSHLAVHGQNITTYAPD